MRTPPLLAQGARVALIAPAGPLRGREDLDRALMSVRRMDWEPVVGDYVLERDGYLAGADAQRLADINRFANDESIDAIWCIRGGYGTTRLLESIDFGSWRRHRKVLIGYSDITALHAAIGDRADLITFHGPTAREEMSPFSADSFRRALVDGVDSCGVADGATTLFSGRVRGRLAGGNLALLSALCGTPYAPDFDGAILVVEDVDESVYRIDRMLTQLRLAGALRRVAGIAFGYFTGIPDSPSNVDRPIARLLQEFADDIRVPCISGIPMGHIADQWTIPLGAIAELDADAKTLTIPNH